MGISIVPIFVLIVFGFCIAIIRRTKKHGVIDTKEAMSVYFLLLALFIWAGYSTVLGIQGVHQSAELREMIPLLWQACVPVIILSFALMSKTLRNALRGVATATPWHWLVLFQALRIGAIGSVLKGLSGQITSDYVFWVGIPDFLFGLSALLVAWLLIKEKISHRMLMAWNLIGPAIVLVPTFGFMHYFMSQPGFEFIFEFPMVLAPSIVVPMFLFLNFLLAWRVFEGLREKKLVNKQASNI